ncbi:MAG: protein translocase subunit SecF, partial [Armatimonadetes bacterium]|nr:protein translocase subunit SecF [Armatimonadota bacterium]
MSNTSSHPFPIVTRRSLWFAVSIVVMVAGFVKMGINKATTGEALNYGIDFTGGSAYTYKFEKLPGGTDSAQSSAEIRQVLETVKVGSKPIEDAAIQVFADGGVQITTPTGSDKKRQNTAAAEGRAEAEAIEQAMRAKFGSVDLVASDLVGPVIGEHLRTMAVWALFWGCLLITLYIWFRYNIKGIGAGYLFGLSAILAMIHDVFIMLAVYAWTNTEVNTNFVAAVLTVVGYSINDTVIIFDRIRENLGKLDANQRRLFPLVEEALETSLWQVMTRSVVTVVCTLLPLVTLFLFGGVTIRNFAFSLLVGIIAGGYSSIFTATPLFALLYRRHLEKTAPAQPASRARTSRPRAEQPVETPFTV